MHSSSRCLRRAVQREGNALSSNRAPAGRERRRQAGGSSERTRRSHDSERRRSLLHNLTASERARARDVVAILIRINNGDDVRPVVLSTEAGKLAAPPVSVTGEPEFVPSIFSCTVPVGVPTPGACATAVAENVTDSPGFDGFFDDATVVAVVAGLTICWLCGS